MGRVYRHVLSTSLVLAVVGALPAPIPQGLQLSQLVTNIVKPLTTIATPVSNLIAPNVPQVVSPAVVANPAPPLPVVVSSVAGTPAGLSSSPSPLAPIANTGLLGPVTPLLNSISSPVVAPLVPGIQQPAAASPNTGGLVGGLTNGLLAPADGLLTSVGNVLNTGATDSTGTAAGVASGLGATLGSASGALGDVAGGLLNGVGGLVGDTTGNLADNLNSVGAGSGGLLSDTGTAANGIIFNSAPNTNIPTTGLGDSLPDIPNTGLPNSGALSGLTNVVPNVINNLGGVVPDLGSVVPDLGSVVPDLGSVVPGLTNNAIPNVVSNLGSVVPDLGNVVPDLGNVVPDLGNLAPDLINNAIPNVLNSPGSIVPDLGNVLSNAGGLLGPEGLPTPDLSDLPLGGGLSTLPIQVPGVTDILPAPSGIPDLTNVVPNVIDGVPTLGAIPDLGNLPGLTNVIPDVLGELTGTNSVPTTGGLPDTTLPITDDLGNDVSDALDGIELGPGTVPDFPAPSASDSIDPPINPPIDPLSGFPINPEGLLYNPYTGLPLNIDPTTNLPINPFTGALLPLPQIPFPTGLPEPKFPTSEFPTFPTDLPVLPAPQDPALPMDLPEFPTLPTDLPEFPAPQFSTLPTDLPQSSNLPEDPTLSEFPTPELPNPPTNLPPFPSLPDDPTLSDFPIPGFSNFPASFPGLPPASPTTSQSPISVVVSTLSPSPLSTLLPPAWPGLPQIPRIPISNLIDPRNVNLLTSVPGLVGRLLNNAAQHKSPNDPNVLGWQDFGCFASRNLFGGAIAAADTTSAEMTPQACIGLCAPQGADYSFVSGNSCYCSSTPPPASAGSTQCTTPCSGAVTSFCGNPVIGLFSVFRRILASGSAIPLPAPPADNSFEYGGCFVATSFISTAGLVIPNVSGIDACSTAATSGGYRYLGLQGSTCYASKTPPDATLETGLGLCGSPCAGNPLQACGGTISQSNRLLKRQDVPLADEGSDPLVTLFLATPAPNTPPPAPDTNITGPTGPHNWFDVGCFSAGESILDANLFGTVSIKDEGSNSNDLCVSSCIGGAFQYAFTQSNICYCSNLPPTTPAANQTDCNTACPGNMNERCGGQGNPRSPDGGLYVNLYSASALLLGTQVRRLISF